MNPFNPFSPDYQTPGMYKATELLSGKKKAEEYRNSSTPLAGSRPEAEHLASRNSKRLNTESSPDLEVGFDFTEEEQASLKEKEIFQEIYIAEAKRLREFFGRNFNIPPIPESITPDMIKNWEKENYKLEYWPRIEMKEDDNYPGWEHKPGFEFCGLGFEFYSKLQEIQNIPENKDNPNLKGLSPIELPGAWILRDTRAKPNYKAGDQEYENDSKMQNKLRELVKRGIINQEASSGLRNNINPNIFKKSQFWKAIAELLSVDKIPGAIVRLPRVIEANVMNQSLQCHKMNTYEWIEEYYEHERRIYNGGTASASYISWGSGSNKGTGFRPLVVFKT